MDSNTIVWILVAGVGIWLFMRMMRGGGCCGGGDDEAESRPTHQHAAHASHVHPTGPTSGHGTQPGPSSPSQVYAIDPVCGMEVSATGVHRSEHNGRTRFFCSARCKESYDADPERFEAVTAEASTHAPHAPHVS